MASAIILLPFYIGYLPTSVYGALSLYLAFSLFIQIVVTYSFDSSIYIHYHDYKGDFNKLSSFISSAFIFMLLISVVAGIVSAVIGDLMFTLIFNDSKISFFPFGIMSVATGVFQALFKVYSNILQSSEKPVLFLRSNLLSLTLITLFTIIGLYYFPETLIGPVGGRMLAGLLVACWVLYRIFSQYGVHFNYPLLRATFGFNHYTFIYQLQQWVINYFDRFLMLFFLPLSTIGIYDFALKCLVVIEILMNALHTSFYPKVVSTIISLPAKGSTPELNRYYHGLTAVVMILISSTIFAMPFLVDFFVNKQGYRDVVQYFPYIAVIYILRSMRLFFSLPYGALKYTKPLPVVYFFVSLVKIGVMVLLIKSYGIYGVVVSSLLAAGIEILMLNYVIKEKFKFKYNAFKIIIAPGTLLAVVLLLEPIFGKDFGWQLHLLYMGITAGFLVWLYRNELKLLNLPFFS